MFPRPSRTRNRGANAVEFALLLPVYILMVGGAVDYGVLLHLQNRASTAAWAGCRAGAAVGPDDSPSATEVAQATIEERLAGFHPFGMECAEGGQRCTITVSSDGTSPSERLICSVTMEYPGLTGTIAMPDGITGDATSFLEQQQDDE